MVRSSGRDGLARPDDRPGGAGQEPAGDPGAEHGAARGDGAQRRGDLVAGRALEDIAARTRRQGSEDGVVVVHHGDHEHGGGRGELGRPPGRLDAGGAGQVDVHEHHIGCGVFDGRQRLLGGAGRAGHLYPGHGGEQPGQAVAEDGMVIDDQDPGHVGTAGTLGSCAGAVTAGRRA